MAILKLNYPSYPKFRDDLVGKIVVIDVPLAVKMGRRAQLDATLPDVFGVEVFGVVSADTALYNQKVIVGTLTGEWRFGKYNYNTQDAYFFRVKLFNHTWASKTGLPCFYNEIVLPTQFIENTQWVTLYSDINDNNLKGLFVAKSFTNRTGNDSAVSAPDTRAFSKGYFDFSNPYEHDVFFNSITEKYKYINKERIGGFPNNYSYEEVDIDDSPVETEFIAPYYLSKESTVLYMSPRFKNDMSDPNYGFPFEIKLLAHTVDEDFTKDTPGVIESIISDNPGGYPTKGFQPNSSSGFFKGLEPNTTYYIRGLYKCHSYVELDDEDGLGIDDATEVEYYTSITEITTPNVKVKPVLFFPGKHSRTENSIRPRVGWEWLGDYPIIETGICYLPVSTGIKPTKDNAETVTFTIPEDIFSILDVDITGLSADVEYWLRTYVVIDNDGIEEVVYPSEDPLYWIVRKAGYRLENVLVGPPWTDYPDVPDYRAYVKTFPAVKSAGTININEIYGNTSTSVSVEVQVTDYGNISEDDAVLYITYSKNTNPTSSDTKVENFDMSRGPYAATQVDIFDLDSSDTYYFAAFIDNGYGIGKSNIVSLKTLSNISYNTSFKTLGYDDSTSNTATIRMAVTDNTGITAKGLVWASGTSLPFVDAIGTSKLEEGPSVGIVTKLLEGLTPNSKYIYRGYVIKDGFIQYGDHYIIETKSLVASSPAIILIEKEPYLITTTGVTVDYNVTNSGRGVIKETGIVINRLDIDVRQDPSVYLFKTPSTSLSTGIFSVKATGLTAGLSYFIRGYVTTTKGTTYSDQRTFVTDSLLKAPNVEVYDASYIKTNSAYISGVVGDTTELTRCGIAWSVSPITASGAPDGISGLNYKDAPTTFLTQYSPTAVSTLRNFGHNATGLLSDTTYYYKLYAENSGHFSWSTQKQFTTENESLEDDTILNTTVVRSDYKLDFSVNITSSFNILRCGYIWRKVTSDGIIEITDESAVSLNTSNIMNFSFFKYEEGIYYVKAFVETSKGIKTTKEYKLEISFNNDSSKKFKLPTDAEIGQIYSHPFEGVTRVWRFNSEGAWERVLENLQPVVTTYTANNSGGSGASFTPPPPEIKEEVAVIEDRYIHYTPLYELIGPNVGMMNLLLYLTDFPKFEYDPITFDTEPLVVTGPEGPSEFGLEDIIARYYPAENAIIVYEYIVESPEEEQVLAAIEAVNQGVGKFEVYPRSKQGYPKSLKPSGGARVYAENVHIDRTDCTLEQFIGDAVMQSITFGCTGIDGGTENNYIGMFYTSNPETSTPVQYSFIPIPMIRRFEIVNIAGILHIKGGVTNDEIYNLYVYDGTTSVYIGSIEIAGEINVFNFFNNGGDSFKTIVGGELISLRLEADEATYTSSNMNLMANMYVRNLI